MCVLSVFGIIGKVADPLLYQGKSGGWQPTQIVPGVEAIFVRSFNAVSGLAK